MCLHFLERVTSKVNIDEGECSCTGTRAGTVALMCHSLLTLHPPAPSSVSSDNEEDDVPIVASRVGSNGASLRASIMI